MKYLIKKSLVLVVLFTTLLANANEISSLRNLNDDKTTMLTLGNVKQGNQLLIKDSYGVILYKENIDKSGNYVKGFDLTSLPNGKYFFELDKELEINIIPFTVKSGNVSFNKEKESIIYKPYAFVTNNMLYVNKLSLKSDPLTVKIFYQNDSDFGSYKLIHTEKIDNAMNIHKAFQLSKYELGNYKVIFNSEGRSFIEYFKNDSSSKKSIEPKLSVSKGMTGFNKAGAEIEDEILNFKGRYFTDYNNNIKK